MLILLCVPGTSQPELGGGVVGPGFVDAYVAADGGQGSVAGLVGDGAVGGSAEVGVGDESGAQAVGAVGVGVVEVCCGDGALDEGVDRSGVQAAVEDSVAFGHGPEYESGVDGSCGRPHLQGGDGGAGRVGVPARQRDEFAVVAGLVCL